MIHNENSKSTPSHTVLSVEDVDLNTKAIEPTPSSSSPDTQKVGSLEATTLVAAATAGGLVATGAATGGIDLSAGSDDVTCGSWFSCCNGLFSGSENKSSTIGGDGVGNQESNALNCCGCFSYESASSSEVNADGVNDSAAESVTCFGMTCGYECGCENCVPSCETEGCDSCDLQCASLFQACSDVASAGCELVAAILG
ncbi:MAG: hypothetical protein CMF41_02085 [Legionellales bacterium]|nr:hypothetical protein [Legionellales bacterium]